MIICRLSTHALLEQSVQGYAFFVEEGFSVDKQLAAIVRKFFPALKALCKERQFTGRQGSAITVPVMHGDTYAHLILIGLGSRNARKRLDIEYYRRAVGSMVRAAQKHQLSSIAVELPKAVLFGVSEEYLAQHTATIAHMTDYCFDDFKRDRISEKKLEVTLCINAAVKKSAHKGLERGELIARAVNRTRHWIDMPPSRMTPTILAQHAQAVAKECGLTATIFDEPEVIKMGMGGLAAVAAGSEQDAKFIILQYSAAKKKAPTIALVGKGITFDSGGLSIKPAQSMETMKEDMAGAAAVINAIGVLAQLKAPVNIIAIAPTTENLPSGTATKPGDIIRFYNGTTAEVKNTDAEGRLILADALSYAVKQYKPDFVIDLATLTGACDYACGPFYSGMLTQNDGMAERVLQASATSGDRLWRLPMHNDYEEAIKSSVADICNIGSSKYKAGTITAAFFLKHFVGSTPWVHVDIASNAFDVPGMSYYESGATGVGVRLLVDLVMDW